MLFKDETGSSIVEVMIATVVFMIIMVGGLNYYVQPQIIMVREKIKNVSDFTILMLIQKFQDFRQSSSRLAGADYTIRATGSGASAGIKRQMTSAPVLSNF